MASETMSTFDSVLKIDYLPAMHAQFNRDVILYNRIKRDRENVTGKEYRFPVHLGWGETSGAIAEGGTIPASGTESLANSFGTVQTVYGRFDVSTKIIHATKNEKGSFVRAVDFKMKNLVDQLKKDLNFMLNSDGSGALAKVVSVAAQVITVDNSLRVRPNMVLNAWDARSGGAQHNGDFTVSSINHETNAVTVVGTITAVVANDFLFKNPGRGINVMGLLGIIDDATFVTTLQNINRSTSPYWKSPVLANAGVKRDLTALLLAQAADKMYIHGNGEPTFYYSFLGQRANYYQLATQDRRYVNTMKFDAGYEALEFNGKPWFVDRDCDKNTIFVADESSLRLAMMSDIDWMQEDGAILARGSNLSYQATLEGHFDFISYQPNKNAVIRDLNEPAGY